VAPHRFEIVVIGASAGGIEAISTVLRGLPSTFPVPIAIVQHRAKGPRGLLAHVLNRATSLRVKDAKSGDELRSGSVYIAPGDMHLKINDDRAVALTTGPKVCFARPSVDVLFASAVAVYGSRVLAILLTGGNSDGTEGALIVRDAGGIVIAQDRASSQQFSMPGSAITAGAVSFILPLGEIGPRLVSLTTREKP
jgi:two-component system chemotaxis response regulator CheB